MGKKDWIAVKIPYGGGFNRSFNLANPKNTRKAPDALEEKFKRQIIFLADNGAAIENLEWYDADIGLWHQNSYDNWKRMDARLVRIAANLFLSEKNILFLGGSHTISYSTISALSATVGENSVGLVVLDAHPDCCQKATWPVHSDWLGDLVLSGSVFLENVILIGTRQVEKEEYDFLKRYKIRYYPMYKIVDTENCFINNWSLLNDLERIGRLKASYMSTDIDFFSQAFAPGTGCPSPDGVSDREGLFIVKQLKRMLKNLWATDLVEISPLNRLQKMILRHDQTVDLGVKIIKEIVS